MDLIYLGAVFDYAVCFCRSFLFHFGMGLMKPEARQKIFNIREEYRTNYWKLSLRLEAQAAEKPRAEWSQKRRSSPDTQKKKEEVTRTTSNTFLEKKTYFIISKFAC